MAQAPTRPGGSAGLAPATLDLETGWHFLHLFYRVDRAALDALPRAMREQGRERFAAILAPRSGDDQAIAQLQTLAVVGHKADLAIVAAGRDLKALHALQTDLACSPLGTALTLAWSYYSITEVSEYVPDVDGYARILRERENMDPDSATFQARVNQYAARLEGMNRQRLTPEFPDWPCLCFYPMNKMRREAQNWYLLPFEARNALMADHGKSGMAFAGRVSQVITASTGLDDWEWGVTLWGRNPQYLKDIVYTMRFDEASARYAEFGPFYFGYILPPGDLLATLRV
jgi:chlorite dismutase